MIASLLQRWIEHALVSSVRTPGRRHMITPRVSIHTRRMEPAAILIAIASLENPVYAITTPATVVGTPLLTLSLFAEAHEARS
jgi:hypothetical protein